MPIDHQNNKLFIILFIIFYKSFIKLIYKSFNIKWNFIFNNENNYSILLNSIGNIYLIINHLLKIINDLQTFIIFNYNSFKKL